MPEHPTSTLRDVDPEVSSLIRQEEMRQADKIRLIPSENYVSRAVMEATGSVFTNKYSEGYPGRRYYEGQQHVDKLEELAQQRVRDLFGVEYVNVQPYSGSPANLAVSFALLEPGDTIMGLHLTHGGHLTHGWRVNYSAKYYRSVPYKLNSKTGLIDYDELEELAEREKPKLIISGATAYSRIIDFERIGRIAKGVGAYCLADIAHIAGLIAGGVHPSPVGVVDVISSTTHKSLRGPRGAMIMTNDKDIYNRVNRAIIPGLQGGPHNHTTAAIAVAMKEAATDEFREYARQIVVNSQALASKLLSLGYSLVSGGSDNHLILIDLTNKGVPGKVAAKALDLAGIVTNYNTIPDDPRKPFDPSGVRIGTPAVTSRGMKEPEMRQIAVWMDVVVKHHDDDGVLDRTRGEVVEMCQKFPAPGMANSDV
jgi:glycine hydroxymethyltransferase